MRLRSTPHTPSPSSHSYPCGVRSVRLLRGYGLDYAVMQEQLRAQLQGDLAATEAGMITGALYAFALWDDPDVEWSAGFDPDTVLELQGAELLQTGRALARELFGPSFQRLGFDRDVLIQQVMPRAVWGLPPEGNDEPLPIQS
jgi:hypothetical protein